MGDFTTSEPTSPTSIDLSSNMPTPGNQGEQGSCVGWATAYALKSYQEKVEMGWPLNSSYTIFSPAFIYNQINGGVDNGSYPSDALKLIIEKGAATWASMPYTQYNYTSQPSYEAYQEAQNFKALSYSRISGTSQIKAALINRNVVLIGMKVYSSFSNMELSGANSLYNPNISLETYQGGHAVTIVGYDDDKFGGAFRIINSYGINWGDDGYFYLPYSKVSDVIQVSYILTDKQNGDSTVDEDLPEVVVSNQPNLEVQSWNATYNAKPGGEGELTYTVLNSGTATSDPYFNVSLVLSKDTTFDNSDIYVMYEKIPFELEPATTALRDQSNPRTFNFPQTLESGTYYMAVVVDDLDIISESNEYDNISLGDSTITIESSLPDIAIDSWWANWDWSSGDASLEYRVCNEGLHATTNTDWDINLVLSTTPDPADDPDTYILFYESAQDILEPNSCGYRDSATAVEFNIYYDHWGDPVPNGSYYMSLWVDDLNHEQESNEINNYSVGNNLLTISNTRSLNNNPNTNLNGKVLKSTHETKDSRNTKKQKHYQKAVGAKNEIIFPVIDKQLIK